MKQTKSILGWDGPWFTETAFEVTEKISWVIYIEKRLLLHAASRFET